TPSPRPSMMKEQSPCPTSRKYTPSRSAFADTALPLLPQGVRIDLRHRVELQHRPARLRVLVQRDATEPVARRNVDLVAQRLVHRETLPLLRDEHDLVSVPLELAADPRGVGARTDARSVHVDGAEQDALAHALGRCEEVRRRTQQALGLFAHLP